MPPRRRLRSGSRVGGGRSDSGPSDSKPAALRRIMQERQSSVKDISGSKSKTSKGATQSVSRGVSSSSSSSSSSLPGDSDTGDNDSDTGDNDSDTGDNYTDTDTDTDSDTTDTSYEILGDNEFLMVSDYGDSDDSVDSDGQIPVFQLDDEGKKIAAIADSLPYDGSMLLLFETPSGFALFTFNGVDCHLDNAVDYLWAEFGDPLRASMMVFPKGFRSFEDKSRAINAATGVDSKLVDLIKKWHKPGMNLCVGKPEHKEIIASVLNIPCMYCQTVMEIMWGIQQQMHVLVRCEKSKLTKEDRLPTSQGLIKFLINHGFDVKPEMVNEKIFFAACALFHCDADDEKNLGLLRDAGLHIRKISGIACEDWDILQLAIAVKVVCSPNEELTDFHEVLAEDVVSKLKRHARKYKGVALKVNWLPTYRAVVSNHHLRIEKKKLLGSLVKKAKKAYEAEQAKVCEAEQAKACESEQAKVCEKGKQSGGESQQIARDHSTSLSNPTTLVGDPTNLAGEVVRRRQRKERTPHKRPKY